MKRSQLISSITLFAALNVVCELMIGLPSAGVWFGMIFFAEAINGIVLGPYAGFLSILMVDEVGDHYDE